jgi:hypothetical protein
MRERTGLVIVHRGVVLGYNDCHQLSEESNIYILENFNQLLGWKCWNFICVMILGSIKVFGCTVARRLDLLRTENKFRVENDLLASVFHWHQRSKIIDEVLCHTHIPRSLEKGTATQTRYDRIFLTLHRLLWDDVADIRDFGAGRIGVVEVREVPR